MYGLRSGRLSRSTSPPENPQSAQNNTTQSPYFNIGPSCDQTSADIEDYSFDAGYVVSSRLSQMVAQGAISYQIPDQAGHSSHERAVILNHHAGNKTNSVASEPCSSRSTSGDVKIKTEPGLEQLPNPVYNQTTSIKQEPGCQTSSGCGQTVSIKQEPGCQTGSRCGQTVSIKQEPGCQTSSEYGQTVPIKQEPDCQTIAQCGQTSIKKEAVSQTSSIKQETGQTTSVKEESGVPDWEPPLWRVQYDNICKMRSERTAPVDTHGCFMLAQRDVAPHVRRYQVLISLMLSSQTKDQITAKAMTNLKAHGLLVENILATPREDIAKMINAVGFWQKKSDYIKRTTEILASKYNGDIPTTLKELMSLPGVGPKMANLVMDFAWGKTTGIAVDTHVHRIAHRLGWMRKQTPNPEGTRLALEKWLPMSEWSNLNLMLVGFGQTLCSPQRPHCEECLNKNICPSSLASSDKTLGGLVGNFSPEALTTGKRKKKSIKSEGSPKKAASTTRKKLKIADN